MDKDKVYVSKYLINSMTDSLSFKGLWFLPENEEDQLTGNLTFSTGSGGNLELIGAFNSADSVNSSHDPILILGLTSTGKKITLYRSYQYSKTINLPGIATINYECLYILIGEHFKTEAEMTFTSVKSRIQHFDEWLQIFGFEYSFDGKNKSYSLQYKTPRQIQFKIDKTIQAEINFSFTAPANSNIAKTVIEQKAELCLRSMITKSLFEILDDLAHFQDFLTIAFFETAYPISISVENSGNNKIEIYYQPNYVYNDARKKHKSDFLFNYNDISEDFEKVIQKWFQLRENIEPVINLLIDVFHNRGKFTENRFLNIIQAIETFHRRTKNNNRMHPHEHKKMIEEILNSTPESYKEWLQEKLHFSNEPSLHSRLKEILENHSIDFISKVIKDTEQFIRDTKNSRNYYTHYDKSLEKKALKGVRLYHLTESLKLVLITIILIESDFEKQKVNRMLERKEFRFFYNLVN